MSGGRKGFFVRGQARPLGDFTGKAKPEALFGMVGMFIRNFLDAHDKNMLVADRAARKDRIEKLAEEDALKRKELKRMRVLKMSMYPRVFKMLGFERGSYPPRSSLVGGRKTGRKFTRGRRP